MKYYNINQPDKFVTLKEATLNGIQGSSSLFMPQSIPAFSAGKIQELQRASLCEIGFEVAKLFLDEEVDTATIRNIVSTSLSFDIPLVHLHDSIHTLELFHGPTLAFKDVGARFMANLFAYFLKNENRDIHILVATSGDTGSAVANAFLNVDGIKVTILYPRGKVSSLQEKQLTTLGGNITALEINGTFDDCQKMVKQAFADADLQSKISLASANSINLARLIPQSFYYFHAVSQFRNLGCDNELSICVPSGNFGNLTAGLMAKRMGLSIKHFIAATNINNVVPQFLSGASFEPKLSCQTISNAMDVGNPSNFVRMMELYNNHSDALRADVKGYSISEELTKETMKEIFSSFNYMLDPHGAVGYAASKFYTEEHPDASVVFLETAHPAKFDNVVNDVLGVAPPIPPQLSLLLGKENQSVKMTTDYSELKDYLI